MKRITYLSLTTFFALSLFLLAQVCFATQWENSYGGSADERANYIQKTSDGGFIMAGYTESYGVANQDIWIIKIKSDGTFRRKRPPVGVVTNLPIPFSRPAMVATL